MTRSAPQPFFKRLLKILVSALAIFPTLTRAGMNIQGLPGDVRISGADGAIILKRDRLHTTLICLNSLSRDNSVGFRMYDPTGNDAFSDAMGFVSRGLGCDLHGGIGMESIKNCLNRGLKLSVFPSSGPAIPVVEKVDYDSECLDGQKQDNTLFVVHAARP